MHRPFALLAIACLAAALAACAPPPRRGHAFADIPREEACAVAAAALENLLDDRQSGKLPWSHIAPRTRSASWLGPALTLADCPAVRDRLAGTPLHLMGPFEMRRKDELYMRLTTPVIRPSDGHALIAIVSLDGGFVRTLDLARSGKGWIVVNVHSAAI